MREDRAAQVGQGDVGARRAEIGHEEATGTGVEDEASRGTPAAARSRQPHR